MTSFNDTAHLTVDSEFQHLIPPLHPDEFAQLEANILAEGCRDPLVVWDGTIIDGHNRYAICTQHGIPFQTVEQSFESYGEAKAWIIRNQFGRRNLNAYTRGVLALQLEALLAAQAKERQGRRTDLLNIPQNSAECSGETRQQLAQMAGVSHDTIHKIKLIEAKADDELKAQLHAGDTTIHAAYTELTRPLESHQLINQSKDNGWYTPHEYIEAAHAVMGGIDLDPASCEDANRIIGATRYYTEADDGMQQSWCAARVWLNPPYGKDEDGSISNQQRWSKKLLEEHLCGNVAEAVLLVNAVTERKWFKPLWQYPLCFTDHRIKFYKVTDTKNQPTHGNAFIYLGPNIARFIDAFSRFGTVILPPSVTGEVVHRQA